MEWSCWGSPLLHQVNKGVLSGSKLSTVHVTPLQTAFMQDFKRLTSLFCASTIGKAIDIINKTNSRNWEINVLQILTRSAL
jgi:hypothetical protein